MLSELEPLVTSLGAYAFAVVPGPAVGQLRERLHLSLAADRRAPEGPLGRHAGLALLRVQGADPLVRQRARCSATCGCAGGAATCKAAFSPRYLVVEALTGALFGVAWWFTVVAGGLFETFDARLVRFAIDAAFCVVMV